MYRQFEALNYSIQSSRIDTAPGGYIATLENQSCMGVQGITLAVDALDARKEGCSLCKSADGKENDDVSATFISRVLNTRDIHFHTKSFR